MSEAIYPEGFTSGYHDINKCRCDGHCLNCFDDLAGIRAMREQKHAEGLGEYYPLLHPRARYCSPYCKGRAARERALDRRLAAVTVPFSQEDYETQMAAAKRWESRS
jgi:hypothetical protein